jgi:hypothetical protein
MLIEAEITAQGGPGVEFFSVKVDFIVDIPCRNLIIVG